MRRTYIWIQSRRLIQTWVNSDLRAPGDQVEGSMRDESAGGGVWVQHIAPDMGRIEAVKPQKVKQAHDKLICM